MWREICLILYTNGAYTYIPRQTNRLKLLKGFSHAGRRIDNSQTLCWTDSKIIAVTSRIRKCISKRSHLIVIRSIRFLQDAFIKKIGFCLYAYRILSSIHLKIVYNL